MGITYDSAPSEIHRLVKEVAAEHHSELVVAGVTVDCIMAYGPKDKDGHTSGPAIKVGGYQAAACIRKTSLRDRAFGNADAQLIIDGDRWDDHSTKRQAALIDHELQHLEVCWEVWPDPKVEGSGIPTRDDLGRPKLAIRLHDMVAGGFIETVKRYGRASLDAQHIRDILDDHGQFLMPFLVDDDGVIGAIGQGVAS